MKIRQITPEIFVRGNLRNVDLVDLGATVATNKIDVIVSLVGEPISPISSWVHTYVVYPIADSKLKLDVEVELNELADQLTELIKTGKKILVNCNAGRNRSCLLIAMVLMRLKNWSGRQALDFVREKRPNAIANPHFENFLLQQ